VGVDVGGAIVSSLSSPRPFGPCQPLFLLSSFCWNYYYAFEHFRGSTLPACLCVWQISHS
jgi:hypothetical protein